MTRRERIDTPSERAKLQPRKSIYWHVVTRGAEARKRLGLSVGYYKPRSGAGTWRARAKVGDTYQTTTLGAADDRGEVGMDWEAAQVAARKWASTRRASGPRPLTTVGEAIAEYVEDLRARKGNAAANEVRGRLKKHLPSGLAARLLADLSAAELRAWHNGLVDDGDDPEAVRRSRDTANRLLTMVRAALNLAFTDGRAAGNEEWRKVKRFKAVSDARKVILSGAELQRLIDACGDGLRELVALLALTGARLGELSAAKVRDFDAGASVLEVRGKTGARPIHLDPTAVTLLRQMASGKRPQDYLLTTAAGGPWTKSLHSRPFAAAVKRAGLDPDTVAYSLRHTWISSALAGGVPAKTVADHCGTSMAMLERFYAKSVQSDLQRYARQAAPAITLAQENKILPLRPAASKP
jgi:integrase